jgi:hypothetical protein
MRQLGPWCETSPPSAAFTVHESAPEARGPYPSASAWVTDGNWRLCSRPHVQPAGAPCKVAPRCATAVANATRITAGAVRCGPPGGLNALLRGSPVVHAASTWSRLACCGETSSPGRSLCTGTLAARHHGWNTASR